MLSRDVAHQLKTAGARLDKAAFAEFMQQEVGNPNTGNVSEAQFLDKATSYFNTCVPSEECTEIWNVVGGGLNGKGTVQPADVRDALESLNCQLSAAEVEDFVAFSSNGKEQMAYDDFVRALFP